MTRADRDQRVGDDVDRLVEAVAAAVRGRAAMQRWSLRALSVHMGCAPEWLSTRVGPRRDEGRRTDLRLREVAEIAAVLGVPLSELLAEAEGRAAGPHQRGRVTRGYPSGRVPAAA